ncbi:MAG: cytochrome c oxidase assembly protein, partial [Geminicoccaceae bacterium]
RRLMSISGTLILALAWLGLPALGIELGFAGHMAVHVAVVAIAAPLLAIGLAGSRLDPTPLAPLLFAPMLASALEFVVVWGWHAPVLHAAARGSGAVLVVEQLSFLTVGLLVWLAAFGRGRGPARAAWGAGILALFLTSMHMTLLGALLALSPRPLYEHAHGAGAFAGMTPLDDQHLGGAVMLLVGGASYLLGGLVLMARLLREPLALPRERSR